MSVKKAYLRKNREMPAGKYKKNGFVCWRHVFTGLNVKTGDKKTFFIECFIVNPSRLSEQPVFGQLYEQKIKKYYPSYIMVKAGTWGKKSVQIHRFYPVSDMHCERRYFDIRLPDFQMGEETLSGSVFMSENDVLVHPEYMSDAGSMSWNLTVRKNVAHTFKNINWHTQGIKAEYGGKLVFCGEDYIVTPEQSYGYADKFWGCDFVSPLIYIASSHIISEISRLPLKNTCFAVGCGGSKTLGPHAEPLYSAVFYYEGERYDFPLSGLWKKSRIKLDFKEGEENLHWLVSAETKKYLFDIDVFCPQNETLFINYEAPSGNKYHNRLWSCGNGSGEIKLFHKGGKKLELIEHARLENSFCEYGEYDMLDFI